MYWLILNLFCVALVRGACYEPIQAFPLPKYDPSNALLKRAFASITTAVDAEVAKEDLESTSFSIEITSSKESLWSLHHTAVRRNESRPDIPTVNGDALYRIASITKTFTVLGVLYQHAAGNLSLDDSIETYVGELRGEQNGSIPWKDITLRTLASQLSGIPREFAQSDLINHISEPWKYGLPPVSRDGLLSCDEYSQDFSIPCDKYDLLGAVKSHSPVFAPNQKSTYSNVAFELLGLVLANVTGLPYESYMDEAIFKPLGMTKSTFATPSDTAGVIPLHPHYWDVDEGIQKPTGGIYSSSSDLSKYLRYILSHYNGITEATNWAHPASPATGLNSFYGMPWEIFHTDRILKDSGRTVRFISKGGGLPGYFSIIMYLPEYDLGITILVAGPTRKILMNLLEIVTVEMVRAAEQVAIEQLNKRYVGTYVSSKPDLNTTMTIVADSRGLVVTQLVSNATDIFAKGSLADIGGIISDKSWYAQLIPTLLYRNEQAREGELWRLLVVQVRDEQVKPVWDDFCLTDVELPGYAGLPLNEMVFWGENKSPVETVELTGFRVKLDRQSENSSLWEFHDDQERLEL